MIKIKGGKKYQKDITKNTIEWLVNHFGFIGTITVHLKPCADWGWCEETCWGNYSIGIDNTQNIRDFVATIVHEMVHVNQYMTNVWSGNGEKEAERLQYKLTDKIWKEGII